MLKTKLRQLRQSNRDLKDSIFLEHEDRYLINQMFAYLWHKNLNAYDTECLRQDLLGMAQEAQQRKQPLREIIGDSHAFCNNLAATCNKKRPLNAICAGLSFCCLIILYITLIPFAQPYKLTITVDHLFVLMIMELGYYFLWFRVIPLPYTLYNHSLKLLGLLAVSWYLLFYVFFAHSQFYQEYVHGKVLFTFSAPASLVFVAALVLGYVGFAYASDTLAYRQSSFRR